MLSPNHEITSLTHVSNYVIKQPLNTQKYIFIKGNASDQSVFSCRPTQPSTLGFDWVHPFRKNYIQSIIAADWVHPLFLTHTLNPFRPSFTDLQTYRPTDLQTYRPTDLLATFRTYQPPLGPTSHLQTYSLTTYNLQPYSLQPTDLQTYRVTYRPLDLQTYSLQTQITQVVLH